MPEVLTKINNPALAAKKTKSILPSMASMQTKINKLIQQSEKEKELARDREKDKEESISDGKTKSEQSEFDDTDKMEPSNYMIKQWLNFIKTRTQRLLTTLQNGKKRVSK